MVAGMLDTGCPPDESGWLRLSFLAISTPGVLSPVGHPGAAVNYNIVTISSIGRPAGRPYDKIMRVARMFSLSVLRGQKRTLAY